MGMSGQVLESWTACLRSFSALMRMSAAFLRSASDSMLPPIVLTISLARIPIELRQSFGCHCRATSRLKPTGRCNEGSRAALGPIGSAELRRDRAAVDLAGAVERQRGDDVDKTGMRIGRSLGQAKGLEILGRHSRAR